MKSIDSLRADALLAASPRNRESPFYIEASFLYKLRRDRQRAFKPTSNPPDPVARHLARCEWESALDAADLSAYERVVTLARMGGYSQDEIASRFSVTRQAIGKVMGRAAEKIRKAHQNDPLAGLRDVYLAEIRRGKRTQNRLHPSD